MTKTACFAFLFRVDPGVVGAFAVTTDLDQFVGSVLSDANFGTIPFTAVSGTIVVDNVPEPASLSVLVVGLTASIGVRRRRAMV